MDSMESEKSDIQKQKRILMRILAEELSESQRKTFWAYHVEKKTVEQIAEEQGGKQEYRLQNIEACGGQCLPHNEVFPDVSKFFSSAPEQWGKQCEEIKPGV